MNLKRSVRIVKKVNDNGVWKFVSLGQNGKRYVWDERPGPYFLDWWEAGKRRREFAGETPTQALTAQRRKQHEVAGALVLRRDRPASTNGSQYPLIEDGGARKPPTPISDVEIGAVAAAANENLRFQIKAPGLALFGTLGENPVLYRSSPAGSWAKTARTAPYCGIEGAV